MIVSKRVLVGLTVWLLAGFVVAAAVLPFLRSDWPAWVLPVVLTVLAASVAGPMIVFGWMLGRVFARHGGWVGALLSAGIVTGAGAQTGDLPWLALGGWIAAGAGLVGLVLLAVFRLRAIARANPRPPKRSPRRSAPQRVKRPARTSVR